MAKSLIVHQSATSIPSGEFINVPGYQFTSAEIATEYAVTHDCTFSNLRGHITSGGSGTNTLQVRKNAADVNLVAAGVGAGALSDLTHNDSFVAGDLLSLSHIDTGSSPEYRHVTLNVEFDQTTGTYFRNSFGPSVVFDVPSETRFIPVTGRLAADGTATEAHAQIKLRGYSKVDAFQVRVNTNARVNDTVLKLRLNGADITASTITIAAGTTGLFMATSINAAIADGGLLCAAIVTGTGVEDLNLDFLGVTLLSASDATEVWAVSVAGTSRTASATPSYYVPGGGLQTRTDTTGTGIIPGFAADCTGLRIYLSANTYSANATLKLFVDGADSGFTTTITAGATGWLENAVDTETITSANAICFEVVGGTSGSITILAIGVTLEQPSGAVPPSAPTKPRRSGGGVGIGGRRRPHAWPALSVIDHN